jgi:hypothetical protein
MTAMRDILPTPAAKAAMLKQGHMNGVLVLVEELSLDAELGFSQLSIQRMFDPSLRWT